MKHQLRFFCLCLISLVITACETLGVPPQSTVPSQGEPTGNGPTATQGQITSPQMTETALAVPTAISNREAINARRIFSIESVENYISRW